MEDLIIKEQLNAINELYITKRDVYIKQKNDGSYSHSSSFNSGKMLTDAVVKKHLNRKQTIGIMCNDSSSKFITFDVDAEGYSIQERKEIVRGLIREIMKLGIDRRFIYIIDSGSKGYHVTIFFSDLVYLNYLHKFYEHILYVNRYNNILVEFRPTPTIGVKLPLSINKKSGRISRFVDDNFEEILDPLFITRINIFDRDTFNDIVCDIDISDEKLEIIRAISDEFKPNKLQLLSKQDAETLEEVGMTHPSTRNYCMVQLAVLNNSRGLDKFETINSMNEWISKQDKDLYKTPLNRCFVENKKIAEWVYKNDIKHSSKQNMIVKISNKEMTIVKSIKNKKARFIMFALLCHNKRFDSESFYMSYNQIEHHSGVRRNDIRKSLDILIGLGYIEEIRSGKYKQTNIYKVLINTVGSRNVLSIKYTDYDNPYYIKRIN